MSIPSRHSAKAAEKYASVMREVSDIWPECVVVNPFPYTIETFACRFRDAVRGVVEFGADPTLLESVQKWASNYNVASVPTTDTLVIGRPDKTKSYLKEKKVTPEFVGVVNASLTLPHVASPSEEVIQAIVTLLNANFLEHAIISGVKAAEVEKYLVNLSRPIELIEQNGVITLL